MFSVFNYFDIHKNIATHFIKSYVGQIHVIVGLAWWVFKGIQNGLVQWFLMLMLILFVSIFAWCKKLNEEDMTCSVHQ